MAEISLDMLVALGRLSDDHRFIVVERIVRGQSLMEVARSLGVSREWVRRVEGAALSRLRRELEGLGYDRRS